MKRWPRSQAYLWEEAPFFRLLLPLIAGIICYDAGLFSIFTDYQAIFIALSSMFVFIACTFIKNKSTLTTSVTFLAFNLALFHCAYLLCATQDVRKQPNWFGNTLKTGNAYLATVSTAPIEKEKTWKMPVRIVASMSDKAHTATGDAIIYLYKWAMPPSLQKGDTIILPNKWQPIKNSGNPFEFDYSRFCSRNGLYYQQFLAPYKVQLYKRGQASAISLVEKSHDWCTQQLRTYIHDTATLGLIQAMLLGDEVNMDPDMRQAYADTGIIHIVAISGSNIMMFFVVISALLFWIRNKKYHWLKYIIALPLVWFYVFMAGAPPSAIRAAIMFSVLALGLALQKNQHSLNQLLATAFILLCAQPMWLYAVGFQLSFVAVLSLIIFYAPIHQLWAPPYKILKPLWATICASLAAEILVAPLVIYYFHMFPTMFLLANVIAYLFMGLVLILGIAIIALSPMTAIAAGTASLTVVIATFFNHVVHTLQGWDPASFHFLTVSGFQLLLCYLCILGLGIFWLRQKKSGLFIGLLTACLFMFSTCIIHWQTLHQQRLIVYNSGNHALVESVNGPYYTPIFNDSAFRHKDSYLLKAAHTGWHCRQSSNCIHTELHLIAGKKVLFFDKNLPTGKVPFPIDVLIINNPLPSLSLADLKSTFAAQELVVCGHQTKKYSQQWRSYCLKAGIHYHFVKDDGVFLLE
ncbi:MAG: ComEC/Rec2 family competence protein [Bacteroidota bacterium]